MTRPSLPSCIQYEEGITSASLPVRLRPPGLCHLSKTSGKVSKSGNMLFKLSHLVAAICGGSLVAAQNVPITGVKVAAGADVPYRQSIDALQAAGGPQWCVIVVLVSPFVAFAHLVIGTSTFALSLICRNRTPRISCPISRSPV